MVNFEKTVLSNGLTLITHQDKTTPLVCVNILYNVGSKDENPERTGFAHLFEHLMFGGSKNIPNYDNIADNAGAENNAFTNNDITNFHITLPSQFLETALWLESDRMNELAFSEKSLEVQKNVVTEEFRQRYLNQPYGDLWPLLRSLSYKVHPYQWCTIGKDISHIQNADIKNVKDFFYRFYRPNNAIMSIAGNIDHESTLRLVEKWFGDIPRGAENNRQLPKEPEQTEARTQTVFRDVPNSMIVKTYKMCNRQNPDYYAFDLISDILSNGKSSRLYNELVKKEQLFSKLDAYITGDIEEGLFVFSGYLNDGVEVNTAEKAILQQIEILKNEKINELELQKVKNNVETTLLYSQYKIMDRALNLSYSENLGDANWFNLETEKYSCVKTADIQRIAQETFTTEHSSTLYYLKNEK